MDIEANNGTPDNTMDAVLQSNKWPVKYARTNPVVREMVCSLWSAEVFMRYRGTFQMYYGKYFIPCISVKMCP